MSTELSDAISQQGHYAGAATRLAAFAIDQSAATAVFAIASAVMVWVVTLVTAGEIDWEPATWLTGIAYVVWLFLYYSYPWSISGKTLGMALVGIRVVRADGAPAGVRNATLRTLALPLSFLTLGLGFLPIVVGRQRRALHDVIAGTAVVYAWDARAARLRFLARQHPGDAARPA